MAAVAAILENHPGEENPSLSSRATPHILTSRCGFPSLPTGMKTSAGRVGFVLLLAWSGVAEGDSPPSIDWHFEFSGGGSGKLVWQSESDRSYHLTYSAELVCWSPVAGFPKLGSGGPMEHSFTAGTRGFFKITSDTAVPAGFVIVPAGSFLMGDSFDEWEDDEIPVHSVDVSGFYMGEDEVTKTLWTNVRTWGATNGYTDLPEGEGDVRGYPVHSVDWFDAVKWCNARSEMEGLDPCYAVSGWVYRTGSGPTPPCDWNANGYRLPTEAEWEKAARGGLIGNRFPWGDTINHSHANYVANGSMHDYDTSGEMFDTHHPTWDGGGVPHTSVVGSFAPNGYGLYDMAGNLFEWCWDWWLLDYYSSSPGVDPRGPDTGSSRIIRGGSWDHRALGSRCAQRGANAPGGSSNTVGFRVVRSRP